MIPSERIKRHLEHLRKTGLASNPVMMVAQAIANALDEDHHHRVAAEARLLEAVLTALAKTGTSISPQWFQDLQDLRGKPRLVNPRGDQLLVELMQLIAGNAQEAALQLQPQQPTKGDPNAKPQQD